MLAGYMLTSKNSNNKMLSSDITWQMTHTRWKIYFYFIVAHVRYIKIDIQILTDSEVLGSNLQIFHDSIVSQFPEETWPRRKSN